MPLENWQKAMLHIAPAAVGVDDDTRKLVQKNLGGAWSAAEMTYPGFVCVMAFWEERGWIDDRHGPGHWTHLATGDRVTAMVGKALKLADLLGWLGADGRVDRARLDGFVLRQTGGRRERLSGCDPEDLYIVIEGLKAILERQQEGMTGRSA